MCQHFNSNCRYDSYTLLNGLHIFVAHANPPHPSQVPSRLSRQVLYHDASQDNKFRLYIVDDGMIREIQAIANVLTDPI